jgi:hypothetical protein
MVTVDRVAIGALENRMANLDHPTSAASDSASAMASSVLAV